MRQTMMYCSFSFNAFVFLFLTFDVVLYRPSLIWCVVTVLFYISRSSALHQIYFIHGYVFFFLFFNFTMCSSLLFVCVCSFNFHELHIIHTDRWYLLTISLSIEINYTHTKNSCKKERKRETERERERNGGVPMSVRAWALASHQQYAFVRV